MIKFIKFLFGWFRSTIYWNAKWMWYLEKNTFLSSSNQWIILWNHRMSLETSTSNLTVIAPTRQGKSSRIVIQNILWSSWNVVVTDPSGELYKKTSGSMAKKGFLIQVFQPANIKNSLGQNPLSGKSSSQELIQLSDSIAKNNSNENDKFWSAWASIIMCICMKALIKTNKSKWIHLWNVRHLINLIQQWWKNIENFMKDYLDDITFNEYLSFIAQDEKTLSWCLTSALTSLKPWSDPEIVKLTATNTIDIPALRNKKTIIYVIVPEKDTEYFSFVVNLFYSECFNYCMDNWDENFYWNEWKKNKNIRDVYFLLDEFWNLWNIKNFATNITTIWKRWCSISIFLQNLSQLRKHYGKDDSESIYDWWTANKIILWWCGLEICQYFEKILWKDTTQETVIEVDGKKRTITIGKPLMFSDEIRKLDKGQAILISWSKKPIKLKLKSCYEDRKIKKLINMKAYKIKSDLSINKVEYVDINRHSER